MRELLERLGLANAVVAVIAAATGVLVIGLGFDFDAGEMLEIFATLVFVMAGLGAFAFASYLVGLLLDAIEKRTE